MAKILIVDWEEEERVHLWSILEEEHELFFASDGKAALDVWQKQQVALVVTELYLPELNGLRLIKELVERDPAARILAISAISADQLDLAEDLGATAILYKPVEPPQLLEAVTRSLEGYRPSRTDRWR